MNGTEAHDILRTKHGWAAVRWLFVVALSLLITVGLCSGPQLVPAQDTLRMQTGQSDTLHSSPWVQEILLSWNADSLTPPRFFCVTSYHKWPAFYYLRHLSLRGVGTQCDTDGAPLLIQALVCPEKQLVFKEPTRAAWVIVQCAPLQFQRYDGAGTPQPQAEVST